VRTIAIGLLLVLVTIGHADEPKPPQLTPEEQKLALDAVTLIGEAFQLNQRGRAAEALGKARAALAIRETLYPPSKYPDGHPDLAGSLNILGFLHMAMGTYEKSLVEFERSLAMKRRLYPVAKHPNGHGEIALALNNLGNLMMAMGSFEKALPLFEQALAMKQSLYPASKYPDGHPDLALGISNLGMLLLEMGAHDKALPLYEQALAMRRALYPPKRNPDGHPELANSLNNVGYLLHTMGSVEKALPHYEQALAMTQKMYSASTHPDGHPHLALCLNNIGFALVSMGSYEKSLTRYEQAVEMKQKLYPPSKYPDGHPELALGINNLAGVLQSLGSFDKALPHVERALEMRQTLYPAARYPDGHPDLAQSANNLGYVYLTMGDYEKALTHYEAALAMKQRLYPASKYPDGHLDLALSMDNLAGLLHAMGSPEKSLPIFERALAMRQKLGRRVLTMSSEAEALAFVNAQPLTRDSFLSLTTHSSEAIAAAYGSVWTSKSAIARLLEQRHAAARVAGTEHAQTLDALKGLRRRIDQLLQDRRLPSTERDALLTKASDERDGLERKLAKALPMLQRADDLDALGPTALAPLLPEGAVLIDFVRYARIEYNRAKRGNAAVVRMPSYAAFVLASGRSIQRIELGDATAIDRAAARWRTAIESRTETSEAKALQDLVWSKLAPHLPADTKTLYLAPDGNLASIPWAALPIGRDRVLLEGYAVATVPHGAFLLEQLKYPREFDGKESTLALGGLEYGPKWSALPGTKVELEAIVSLAARIQGEREVASGGEVTSAKMARALVKARYAHLATHGEFRADEFAAEKKRELDARKNWQEGQDIRRVAAKNPLGFVGVVLGGGEVMSGLSIVDLNLDNLKLVTLSACETGLGEFTGAKGVENLQMAFHIAGAENVIASLWKVSDSATAALMAKFYHELWVEKKEPLAALRAAQLTIYHHPELIPDLAGERGAPKAKEALSASPAKPPAAKRADTKLWAAFVLSGAGR